MTVLNFSGVSNGTDLSALGFTKEAGSAVDSSITVTSGELDFNFGSGIATYSLPLSSGDCDISCEFGGYYASYCSPIVFRIQDYQNYWAVRAGDAGTINLIRVVSGSTTGVSTQSISRNSSGDIFRVLAIGSLIKVYFNGAEVISVTDSTWSTNNKIGMSVRLGTELALITTYTYIDPAVAITSINGGSPITAGQSGIASVSTGFSGLPATITTNASGVTCSNIGGTTNAPTFTITDRVDGGLYPKSGTSVNFTFVNGTENAVGAQTIVKKSTETKVVIASPLFSDNTIAQAIFSAFGRTVAAADEFYHTTYSDLVITSDTDFTVTAAGSFDLWLYVNAGADAGKNYYYAVTITESGAGVISGGLTTSGLTTSGLTTAGITSAGF
jgi:hypothetical protein